ncbi:MAG: DUF177 domain-containing protein [Muribaculaceae bacterium]
MGKFIAFKLPLKGMPNETQQFEYNLGTEFFRDMESADVLKSDVTVTLTVKHVDDAYDLNFNIKGVISIPCDRCLDAMEHEVDTIYHLTVKYGEEYSDENDDVLIIPETENFLNVAYMIYDSVILTIPLKHVHQAGKCNKGMNTFLKKHVAKSSDDDDESEENIDFDESETFEENNLENDESVTNDPRWDALKDLKDNN